MKSNRHRPWVVLGLLATLIVITAALTIPAFSYLPNLTTVNGQNPLVTSGQPGANCATIYTQNCNVWDFNSFPVVWSLNPTTAGANISGSVTPHDVIVAAFSSWQAAPNATLTITEGPTTLVNDANAAPSDLNLICFICNGSDQTIFSDASTLAVTMTTTANASGQPNGHGGLTTFGGQIIQGIILFNPTNSFVTSGTPTSSQNDLGTIATHEIGHFFGLDHSAVVAAVMFPFAPPVETTLSYDDVAAISLGYPSASQAYPAGAISGKVTLSNAPVFGAHVYAESTSNLQLFQFPNIRKSAVGALTKPDGSYTITGLPADNYVVIAEPLDGPVDNSNVAEFATTYGQAAGVQTNFTTRWH